MLIIAAFQVFSASIVLAQAAHPQIFWVRGFGIDFGTPQMLPIANWMHDHYFNTVTPIVATGMNPLNYGLEGNTDIIQADLPGNGYIGVGYSMGGNIVRKLAQRHTTDDGASPYFMLGAVSMDTPHLGALIAANGEAAGFVSDLKQAESQVNSAEGLPTGISGMSHFAGALNLYDPSIVLNLGALGITIAQLQNFQLASDAAPNSSAMQALNASPNVAKEGTMIGGRAIVCSTNPWPRLAGFQPEFHTKQVEYVNWINTEQKMADSYLQQAKSKLTRNIIDPKTGLMTTGMQQYIVLSRISSRYRSVADGFRLANTSWEYHTARNQPSDAFVPLSSQQGWPGVPAGNMFNAEGSSANGGYPNQSNHGRVVAGDANEATHLALVKVGMTN